jgi:RsiW-degrading membrane proteinase PrsW (M82 family)
VIGDVIIANVLASACLVLLIYFLDINEKEPSWTLLRIFVISIFITFLFGMLKTHLFKTYNWESLALFKSDLFNNYVVAGFFEELLKFIIVMLFVWRLKSFNEESDGIIYYLIVAAGFTVFENVFYSINYTFPPYIYGLKTGDMSFFNKALQEIVLLRAVSGHIYINVVSGFFLGFARRRRKYWLLIPGFIISVLLHGTWNQMAVMGKLVYFLIGFIILDAVLFVWIIRMSFYYKFMKRLKFRMNELIEEAKKINLNEDLIIFMKDIMQRMKILRQMSGETIKKQAIIITRLLPPKLEKVPIEGEDGLYGRLITINGILGRNCEVRGKVFWVGLYLKFCLSGFFLIILLMNFIWK